MMVKQFKKDLWIYCGMVILGAVVLLAILFSPASVKMVSASGNSTSSNATSSNSDSSGGEASDPTPARPADEVEGENMIAAIVEEATKPENRTVEGQKSEVNGFYLANSVNGVALKDANTDANTKTYVEVLDTDANKSTAAVAAVESVAAGSDLEVGPCIDMYFKQVSDGKFGTGSAGSIGAVTVGVPKNFQRDGAEYSAIIVYPGGATETAPITMDGNKATFSMTQQQQQPQYSYSHLYQALQHMS